MTLEAVGSTPNVKPAMKIAVVGLGVARSFQRFALSSHGALILCRQLRFTKARQQLDRPSVNFIFNPPWAEDVVSLRRHIHGSSSLRATPLQRDSPFSEPSIAILPFEAA